MAGGALRLGLAVIEAYLLPRRRHVTCFADPGRWYVRPRFTASNRTVVTTGALPRRSLEAIADVTGRAINPDMCAREWKACREMIKRRAHELSIARHGAE
jgi:hypothetical protein